MNEFSGLDVVPPEQVDRIVAWCFLKYPGSGRDAALECLRRTCGIQPEAGAPMVDQALWRSQYWTPAEAEALAAELEHGPWDVPVPVSAAPSCPTWSCS